MHPRRVNGNVMMGLVAFRRPVIGLRMCERDTFPGGASWLMGARLGQRIQRPAALPGRRRWRGRAFHFLLAKLPRRQSETMAKRPAEMRGIAKAVAIGDFG